MANDSGNDNENPGQSPKECPTPSSKIKFLLLNRLAIEQERADSTFAEQFLGALVSSLSGVPENLEVVELPLHVASRSRAFFDSVGGSIQELTVHCDGIFRGTGDAGEPKYYNLDLRVMSLLRDLHLVIPAHADYDLPAIVALHTLVGSLAEYPYNTLTTLRLSFRTTFGYSPYSNTQWQVLDDTLSLPHLAGLTRVEIVGLGCAAALVRKGLPNACTRGIVHFLW
ncbi:hypothetical protein M408DRAFT_253514 [Serendipita vermifera MAFF 305830]|uniref:Uncharacterized protein n=1 Tax=Serendipita vermifera MAFF 305830 TaxID=933852 RepID=A0A0C3AU77_SERVB|nr:hypothetical protein M408DRAFT_253514 [Serendipita vermifera MAFF 305830]